MSHFWGGNFKMVGCPCPSEWLLPCIYGMYIRLSIAHQKERHKTEGGRCIVGEPRERHRKEICGGYNQDALNTSKCISFAKSKFVKQMKESVHCPSEDRKQQLGSWWSPGGTLREHKPWDTRPRNDLQVSAQVYCSLQENVCLIMTQCLTPSPFYIDTDCELFFSYCSSLCDISVQSWWQGVPTEGSSGRQWSNTICTRILKPSPN